MPSSFGPPEVPAKPIWPRPSTLRGPQARSFCRCASVPSFRPRGLDFLSEGGSPEEGQDPAAVSQTRSAHHRRHCMGIKQLPRHSGEYLFEVITRRYENRSTIMTSNRPVEEWGKLLQDVPTASAIRRSVPTTRPDRQHHRQELPPQRHCPRQNQGCYAQPMKALLFIRSDRRARAPRLTGTGPVRRPLASIAQRKGNPADRPSSTPPSRNDSCLSSAH